MSSWWHIRKTQHNEVMNREEVEASSQIPSEEGREMSNLAAFFP
jgi:hypothetical protein